MTFFYSIHKQMHSEFTFTTIFTINLGKIKRNLFERLGSRSMPSNDDIAQAICKLIFFSEGVQLFPGSMPEVIHLMYSMTSFQ